MIRKIFASREAAEHASISPNKIVKVHSMFPIDRAGCPCADFIRQHKKRLAMANQKEREQIIAQVPVITCPRDKSHMQHYAIICGVCKEIQGYVWATTPTLEDWCDFHYVQWTKGDYWHGCFTPHVSPVSEELCFECCCGNDTRDFRANMTLPEREAVKREKHNSYGRQFGRPESKFFVRIAQ